MYGLGAACFTKEARGGQNPNRAPCTLPRDKKTVNVCVFWNITATRRVAPIKAKCMEVIGYAELVKAPTSQKW